MENTLQEYMEIDPEMVTLLGKIPNNEKPLRDREIFTKEKLEAIQVLQAPTLERHFAKWRKEGLFK